MAEPLDLEPTIPKSRTVLLPTCEERPHHMGLGGELRLLRFRRGWSQMQMTRWTGMPQAKISRIELGKGNPTLETIRKLADALGVRVEIRLVECDR